MTKKDLVKHISDTVMITERDAGVIFDVLFDGIKEGLESGEEVKIREFGTFFIQERKARKAYSPLDQSPIDVPARKGIKFRVSKDLTKRIN